MEMLTTNFKSTDRNMLKQQARLTDWTWEGAKVIESKGKVAELFAQIPFFSRQPARVWRQENRSVDEICREPLNITDEPIPVATVSKTYSLIQHRDVLASVFQALKILHIDICGLESTLLLSEYGERMQWSCDIPSVDFDPGDGNPMVLRINCLNSVDTTTVLEIAFSWFRLVCANGMMFGLKESRLRRRHIRSLDPEVLAAYLDDQLGHVDEEMSLYTQWYNTSLVGLDIDQWIDEKVAQDWGPHAAARAWHIITTGTDGDVRQMGNRVPHELEISESSEVEVPGSCAPAENLFHVSQALSWIAGTRQTIPERLEYVKAIPGLMEPLTDRQFSLEFTQTRN
jgi:hypothetical protein